MLFKLIITLIPDRIFAPKSTPATYFNVTPNSTAEPELSTWLESLNDTSSTTDSTSIENTSSSTIAPVTLLPTILTTPISPTTSTRRSLRRGFRRRNFNNTNSKWREARQIFESSPDTETRETVTAGEDEYTEPDDSRYNKLMLTGQNSYQSILTKMSTRGDIPGDTSEDDPTTSTTPIPTSSSTFTPFPDDNVEKLITTIRTMIQLVSGRAYSD